MASYRIGPADFFTGGDLAADANTLNAQFNHLDTVIGSIPNDDKKLDNSGVLDAYYVLEAQWQGYFQNTFAGSGAVGNFLTALNDSNRDQLIQYEQRFDSIVKQISDAGYDTSGIQVSVSSGSPSALWKSFSDALKSFTPWGIGIGSLLVLVLVVWFFVIR